MARMTMKSLARAVGVSVTTVSNAYNHPERLSAELRARILAAGEQLGYSGPDAAGRLLRSGRAMAVGVLCGSGYSFTFDDHRSAALLRGIGSELEHEGVALQLLSSGADEQDTSAVARAAVDAIICLTPRTDTAPVQLARRRGIPVIHTSRLESASYVAIDQQSGARQLAASLADAGHLAVTLVGGVGPEAIDVFCSAFGGRVQHVPCGRDAAAIGAAIDRSVGSVLVASDSTIAVRLRSMLPTSPGTGAALACLDIPDSCWETGLVGVSTPVFEQGRTCGRLALDPLLEPRQVVLPVRLQQVPA